MSFTRLIVSATIALGVVAQTRVAHAWWVIAPENQTLAFDLVHPTRQNYSYAPVNTNGNSTTLVLFLAGSGGQPSDYQEFMTEAVRNGYYVIGLDYVNDGHEWEICGCEADCYGQLWKQTVEMNGSYFGFYTKAFTDLGIPLPLGVLASDNAIGNRLVLYLNWLQDHQASGEHANWAQFLNSGQTEAAWSKVVVAGHSRGSDIATWMLLHRGTKAALGFSAINNYLNNVTSTSCDTPAEYRLIGLPCADGTVGSSVCTPTEDIPSWDPPQRSSPYPNLYLFDSVDDPNFDQQGHNDQFANTTDFGWECTDDLSRCYDLLYTCPATFTSNWLLDATAGSSHGSTIADNDATGLSSAARTCVWDHMLSLP